MSKQQTLYMMMGIPGCGKTTKALEMLKKSANIRRVNRDDIRAMLGGSYSKINEEAVRAIRNESIKQFLVRLYDVIVDDTNIEPTTQQELTTLALSLNPQIKIEIVRFDTPLHVCIGRDAQRPNPVGEGRITEMHKRLEKLWPLHTGTAPEYDMSLPNCIIVDIDGTITMGPNNRSPYEWDKVGQDLPRKAVIKVVEAVAAQGDKKVFFMSGRDSVCMDATWNYINENVTVRRSRLIMRAEGDQRRDSIVKKELYEQHIFGKYNVQAIFDDRPQVIRECWRRLGFADRLFDVRLNDKEF